MGISIDGYSRHYIHKLSQATPDSKAAQKVRGERKFDEVLISASSRQTEEKKVTEGLVQEAMSQVHSQVPGDRLEALKAAVESGEYRVDAYTVASRMLLIGGEGAADE